jgi:tetratricopeptide (TPR) repeat protein
MVEPQAALTSALSSRYAFEEEIGSGGMAIVYRAWDRTHNRMVAIKVLRPELSASMAVERFLREVEIEAGLQHPHILPLYDSGQAGEVLYYVMPFVEGESLRDRLRREAQLPFEEAELIASQVADALDYAHSKGIVHRDIKPGNILLSSGHALVSDFGIARAVTEAGGKKLTLSGIVIGTPAYMSPEQAGGMDVDPRSDIYSLGCVLYEMVTGEVPFAGRSAQAVLTRHMLEDPPSVEILRPNTPPEVRAAIGGALAKFPAERISSAGEFIDTLAGRRAPVAVRARRLWRRQRTRRLVELAASLAVLGGISYLALRSSPAPLSESDVVVFPFVQQGSAEPPEAGDEAAMAVGLALEHAPPLVWTDGRQLLDERLRERFGLFTPEVGRRLTRTAGSRYFIEGSVRSSPDARTVLLTLHDVQGDSVLAQSESSGPPDTVTAASLAMQAVRDLLPALDRTAPYPGGGEYLDRLLAGDPVGLAHLARGQAAYRDSRFGAALNEYQESLASDSTLAFAAVKGAQAASWLNDLGTAERLLLAAPEDWSSVPKKYAAFARGLRAYIEGQADSAVAYFTEALAIDSTWSEAHMALGEVYHHLLPSQPHLDSLAEASFEAAHRHDEALSAPLVHLTEIAIRRGSLERADSLIALLQTFEPDPMRVQRLRTMADCVATRPGGVDWSAMLSAGLALSKGGAQLPCAEDALRVVLAAEDPVSGAQGEIHIDDYRWGAMLALQSILIAEHRYSEATAMIDSSVAAGESGNMPLFIMGALAGAPMEARAREVQEIGESAIPPDWAGVPPYFLYFLGAWYARLGDLERVETMYTSAAAQADTGGDARARLVATALAGHVALLEGDTAETIRLWSDVPSVARRGDLLWDLDAAIPVERLELARLLLATGRAAEAHDVAEVFDHGASVILLQFLPESLRLRQQAALAMNRRDLAADYRERLLRLGYIDATDTPSNPTTTGGDE